MRASLASALAPLLASALAKVLAPMVGGACDLHAFERGDTQHGEPVGEDALDGAAEAQA